MKKVLKISFIIFLILILICTIGTIIYLDKISANISLNDLDKLRLFPKGTYVSVYDNNGNNLVNDDNYIRISNLNNYTKNAFISIEDKDFYKHNGLNFKRIVKALVNNIKSRSFKEGASTISQQLVKNTQLSNEKTIERKIKEIYITQELEKEYSKDQILEMYLNVIYFGNSSYGIENASLNYFGKSAKTLSISESATLAGIIKSPATYCPINNLENCIKRRNIVLKEMEKDGYITDDEYNQSINETIQIKSSNTNIIDNTVYYDYTKKAIKEASLLLGLTYDEILNSEYKITTYLDLSIQNKINTIINNDRYKIKNKNNKECEGLISVVDNKNNSLIAYTSNTNYDTSELVRQPGSAIKPIIVYAPALQEKIITPLTKIMDEPINIDGYTPKNLGNIFHGNTSIRDCVSYSYNIPAVKIMKDLSIEKSKSYGRKFGITFDDLDNGYAIALGGFTKGIELDELTNAYSVFANNGYYKPVTCIKEIKNKYGVTIYKDFRQAEQIIDDDTAFLMTSILQDGVKVGTSKRLNNLNCDIAGKTGTVSFENTNENTDAISVAYTTDYSASCWFGNYTMKPEYNLDSSNNGGTYATSVLNEVFSYINTINQPTKFEIPQSVVKCKINNSIYIAENNIVMANESLDDRYIIEDYFSVNNLPPRNHTLDYECKLNLEQKDKSIYINFNANKSYIYKIIRISDNKEEIIATIDGNDNGTWIDNNITYSSNYIYYIKYKLKGSSSYQISNKENITLNFSQGSNTPDYNWLFS